MKRWSSWYGRETLSQFPWHASTETDGSFFPRLLIGAHMSAKAFWSSNAWCLRLVAASAKHIDWPPIHIEDPQIHNLPKWPSNSLYSIPTIHILPKMIPDFPLTPWLVSADIFMNSEKCRGTCYLVNMFGPPFCSLNVSLYLIKRQRRQMMCKQYERRKTAQTKRTFKTKRYKQIQIYISTIHAIKHFKTLVF